VIESGQVFSLIASFVLVIALLAATLWVLKRIGLSGLRAQSGKRIVIVDSVWLGNRQRVALIRVDEREILVGSSAQAITLLADLGSPEPKLGKPKEDIDEVIGQSSGSVGAVSDKDRSRFIDAMRSIVSRGQNEKGVR
jgi:flagellar protein FliO/FliZ